MTCPECSEGFICPTCHRLLLALRIGEQRAFKAFREGMPKYEAPMGSEAVREAVDEKEREEEWRDDTIRR